MRAVFFIDGFNLYHEIDKRDAWKKYKWLNLKQLALNVIDQTETLTQVLYFTSLNTWNPGKEKRHQTYINALTKAGVQTIKGKFIPITATYEKHKNELQYILPSDTNINDVPQMLEYKKYVEKRTDVTIASKIIEYAYEDIYDHAYVISADGDIAPAIEIVRNRFPKKIFTAVLPFKAPQKAKDIVKACGKHVIELEEKHISNSQLSDYIQFDQNQILVRPEEWR